MSGSGFSIGLAIASYEWMAALTLIIVAKYFMPVFIDKGIFTIPEFVEKRFNRTLKTILAVFWLALFVFVNLTSVLYLGALALQTILGIPMSYAIFGLALFAVAYSLYGGLSAAIVSSLASMLNSVATIFTMDIYKEYIAPATADYQLVNVRTH